MEQEEKCCGACCWMCYEDTDGWGQCVKQDVADSVHCSDLCTNDKYVSREEMRHHLAVMTQWVRISGKKEFCRMIAPSDQETKEAIRFAVDYIKTFNKL